MTVMLMGVKQAMNKEEIMTTILAAFWLREEALSLCAEAVDFRLHFCVLCSLITSARVQITVTVNAVRGIEKLLIKNIIFCIKFRFSVKVSPKIVLFRSGENFISNLLTA